MFRARLLKTVLELDKEMKEYQDRAEQFKKYIHEPGPKNSTIYRAGQMDGVSYGIYKAMKNVTKAINATCPKCAGDVLPITDNVGHCVECDTVVEQLTLF